MGIEQTMKRLKEILVKQLKIERAPENIGDDEQLFGGGLNLDSIDSLEIIIAIEKEYGLKFTDEQLKDPEKIFKSIRSLAEFVEQQLKTKK